jgi:hypothetical protein
VVLIDSEISAIGSANLDNRSFRLNFEVMLLTVDSAFAAQVEHMLNDDFEQAHEVAKEESREIHRLQQLGMRVARLISPILSLRERRIRIVDVVTGPGSSWLPSGGLHREDLVQVDPARRTRRRIRPGTAARSAALDPAPVSAASRLSSRRSLQWSRVRA